MTRAAPSTFPPSLTAALLATAAPSLLAYNTAPSPTFLNQALALLVWGLFVLALELPKRRPAEQAPLLLALALMSAGVGWSWGPGALPDSLALSALALLAAAALLLISGGAARHSVNPAAVFALFCLGWVIAGVLNTGIGLIQVFAPGLPDGDWIARSTLPGRAVGNLRQPNHLSSLLMWSCIALVPLADQGRLRQNSARALMALFVFGVVLTASRTGVVGVLLLAIWGLLDRRLARPTRGLLLAAPVLYAIAAGGMTAWAQLSAHTFGGAVRLAEADLSSSRFGIWANALELIRQQPGTGVGFGEFNLAWSLTPFPGRPTAFFDHTHNLPLQLLVELGLPLGGAVLGLLMWALWRPLRHWREADVSARGAWMMVAMIGLHSLLEYPLWYAYFLLPAAWAWGYALSRPGPVPDSAGPTGLGLRLAGGVLVLGALFSVWDYQRVVAIFEALEDAPPLAARIEHGRQSLLFSHHADYASVTSGMAAPGDLAAFGGAPHYLLDTRLMLAWARSLEAAGRHHEAQLVVQRLREFRNPQAASFFAHCAEPASAAKAFQCPPADAVPAVPSVPWRSFIDR